MLKGIVCWNPKFLKFNLKILVYISHGVLWQELPKLDEKHLMFMGLCLWGSSRKDQEAFNTQCLFTKGEERQDWLERTLYHRTALRKIIDMLIASHQWKASHFRKSWQISLNRLVLWVNCALPEKRYAKVLLTDASERELTGQVWLAWLRWSHTGVSSLPN